MSDTTCTGRTALVMTCVLLMTAGCGRTRPATNDEPPDAEEVSVGYGTQTRDRVTGSVASVTADEVDGPVTRVEEMLQGRFAGVTVRRLPGGGLSVRIRGTGSLSASNEPLYVVDGVVLPPSPSGGIYGIAPGDIAKIEVLKDAAATAIYGSRGANGVVVITTKGER